MIFDGCRFYSSSFPEANPYGYYAFKHLPWRLATVGAASKATFASRSD